MAAVVLDGVLAHFDKVGQMERGQLGGHCMKKLGIVYSEVKSNNAS